jgi:hypothetical protein
MYGFRQSPDDPDIRQPPVQNGGPENGPDPAR